jgi:restriction system protein
LRRRLINVAERGLISREENFYAITDSGLQWLKGFAGSPEAVAAAGPLNEAYHRCRSGPYPQ